MPVPSERSPRLRLRHRRVAVTGGGGFIGSHLVARLVEEGVEVRLLGPLEHCRPEVRALLDSGCVEIGADALGCEALVHLAYRPPPPPEAAPLHHEVALNLLDTADLLRSAERWGVEHLVFASSVSVYRPQPEPVREDAPVGEGVPAYGVVKAMQEMRCRTWAEATGGIATILRLSSVYGPGETVRRAIPRFIRAAQEGRRPQVAGTGAGRFDPLFVEDAVDAFVAALLRRRSRTYNVGSGVPRTSLEVAELVLRLARLPLTPAFDAGRQDGDRPLPAVERAAADLGFRASTPLETGVLRERAWLREHPPPAGLGAAAGSAHCA
jgi:UDP-glucose 4-epimerase